MGKSSKNSELDMSKGIFLNDRTNPVLFGVEDLKNLIRVKPQEAINFELNRMSQTRPLFVKIWDRVVMVGTHEGTGSVDSVQGENYLMRSALEEALNTLSPKNVIEQIVFDKMRKAIERTKA